MHALYSAVAVFGFIQTFVHTSDVPAMVLHSICHSYS
jgi:hypothetical protein